jgi:hypothetical protein
MTRIKITLSEIGIGTTTSRSCRRTLGVLCQWLKVYRTRRLRFAKIWRPSFTLYTQETKLSSTRIMLAASFETSELGMSKAIPESARVSMGLSLTLLPVTPTMRPRLWARLTISSL